MFEQHRSQQPAIAAPKTTSRIEYIPYFKKFYDYEPREVVDIIYVPVQKTVTDYYAIEHVTDYQMKEYEQTVVDYVPQESTKVKI